MINIMHVKILLYNNAKFKICKHNYHNYQNKRLEKNNLMNKQQTSVTN